jgi:hypothetical protein
MEPKAILAAGIYAALVLSPATSLYDPLSSGRDDSWALFVLLAAAHVGLGAAFSRAWVLVLPIALSVVAFLAWGAEELAWLAIVLGAPALVAFTAIGIGLGRASRQRHEAMAAGFFLVALLPAAWAAVETARRGPPLPAAVQSRLPTETSLANLCPGTATPARVRQDLSRRSEALLRELGRRQTHLVTYTYYSADGDDERREITVRELAEEQLKDMDAHGPACEPRLERRLRDAMRNR